MSNTLLEYMKNRFGEQEIISQPRKKPGPLITISREVGCGGVLLASQLAKELNKRYSTTKWRVLSKEVFYESAKELNMNPDKIRRIFRHESYMFNDILNAFGSKKFKSERKIINTVKEVIHSLAEEGFCIIVGRAAHIIAYDIKNAVHVRVVAPQEYRILNLIQNKGVSRMSAIQFMERVEKERSCLRKAFREETLETTCFDLCLNRSSFSDSDFQNLIIYAAERKNIFSDYFFSSISY